MADVLVTYHSSSGTTKALAEAITDGLREGGVSFIIKPITEVQALKLVNYKAILIGSPVYYGMPTSEIIKFFEESVCIQGRLEGKLGGAFATSSNIGGGNETACLAILKSMMVHGMLITGADKGDHYGPVGVGKPNETSYNSGKNYGLLIARHVKRFYKDESTGEQSAE